jgi:SAM-dependent methyltransferase
VVGSADRPYDSLAGVYDWLVPDALLTPQGSAGAFAPWTGVLPDGARVLDCAAGTGLVAVGLALGGFDVTATDASPEMVARTRTLAVEHGATLVAETCAWDDLPQRRWGGPFDAVLCVGNSLTHAVGRPGRRRALAAMGAVMTGGGLLVLTSRNWEQVRAGGAAVQVADRLVERNGRRGLVIHAWTIPPEWEDRHHLEVAVALLDDDGSVETGRELLDFWPFRHTDLDEDLRHSGFTPVSSTYDAEAERYLVTATRSG